MHPTSRPRPPAARHAKLCGLLGTYPVPELHLVGAPIPDNPRSPTRWQPTPPPLQYGIDYTFTHRAGREPVRWPSNAVITVRIAGGGTQDRRAALAFVVAELRTLTRLNLVTGAPAPAGLAPSAVPDGEIHVGYLTCSKVVGRAAQPGDQAGLGGASRCAAGRCYVSGFAIINAGLAGPDATAEHALAILQHELAHALGLGHAARPSLLMHRQMAASTTRYGRGDKHGLALLGPRLPYSPAVAPCRSHQDAVQCSATSQQKGGLAAPGSQDLSPRGTPRHLVWCSVVAAS